VPRGSRPPQCGARLDRKGRLPWASGGEETRVRVEVAVEVDPSVGEEACDHLVRFPQALDRLLGLLWRHVVLLQQCEVSGAEHELRSTAGQLVESRDLLRHERRILEDDSRDLWSEAQARRTCCSGCKERPHVLVVRLVRGVAGPESKVVKELERAQELVEGVLRKELVAPPHRGDLLMPSSFEGTDRARVLLAAALSAARVCGNVA